jgi:ketosteroid isomerase-like protein
MDRVERLVARDEIRDLAHRYAYAVDHRDIDMLVSLYVPDVRVGGDGRGHEALRRFWVDALREIGVSILFVGNHLIEIESERRASGTVYCIARIEDHGRWIEQAIRYDDDYERHDDRWLFVRRRHRLWYGVERASNPLDQPPAHWPVNQVGRGTVPDDTASWTAFWRETGDR